MANRESRSSRKDFLIGLRKRGLNGVELVVADDHAGLRSAIREVPSDATLQRCCVHFLRNALDHLPRKADRRLPAGAALALRPPLGRRGPPPDLAAWIAKWGARYPRLVAWVEETIEETPSPSTGCRASIISISKVPTCWNASTRRSGDEPMSCESSPNADACRRLVRALAVETHENWLEAHRYLNMNDLKEHKKIQLRQAACSSQP